MRKRTVVIENVDAEELYKKIREIFIEIVRKGHPPPSDKRSGLLTIKETAKFFSVSDRTINNWCRHKLLCPITIGRRVYFEASEVKDLVQKNKIKNHD